ncbi:CHAT domain-containing protein [Leptolyngbya cf. ectocarpi LEGE 11479]|uniref:CHAT domain-containing protein n=1 Tax=Leptolyngbya cf. ectocarpi LEGE 11479 TaxID=1828722 RepID=A0A928X102_LEPEC|nr:CHAT domain-containing protein [Leptolyngbya ectocarpi]MBE9066952.1 CHAT domain-containing protein [Leptolyngbya cf. ectocarpi LEGE 11479]
MFSKPVRFCLTLCLTVLLCIIAMPARANLPELVQRGQAAYTLGQYQTAVQIWQQVVQQGSPLEQASGLSNLGLAYGQLGNYDQAATVVSQALEQLETLPTDPQQQRILAQVLSTQGKLAMAQGRLGEALSTLRQAEVAYGVTGDKAGILRSQLNQAQILRIQGHYRQTLKQLETIATDLETLPNSALKATGLRQLGNALQLNGDAQGAQKRLNQSLDVAKTIDAAADVTAALLSLGNAQSGPSAAAYYQQAAAAAPTAALRLQAQVNLIGSWSNGQNTGQNIAAARQLLPTVYADLIDLPPGRTTITTRLNLAHSLIQANGALEDTRQTAQLLADTLQQAQTLNDLQGQSYALGYLGQLYEAQQQWASAAQVTQQALTLAQGNDADVALYQWQWQLGRILDAQGDTAGAITAYTKALESLQKLRVDLIAASPDVRFSFRDQVEPVYRQLVDLLLKADPGTAQEKENNLLQARNVIESLQVAELVNFFRADCVVTQPVDIEQVGSNAAVIYPIVLEDRLEIVFRLPGQPLTHRSTTVDKATVTRTLAQLQRSISYPEVELRSRSQTARFEVVADNPVNDYLTPAQQLYDWLIRPISADLAGADVDVLVFVLDSALRNVPMSVLHDGNQHLVETYPIALTPGLQLIDPEPLARRDIRALVAGLSDSVGDFPALPNVDAEIAAIQAQVPSDVLLNQSFVETNFANKLTTGQGSVVHLATHGEFSSELENTFVLAWDGPLNANQLSALLQSGEISRDETVELLILSACETAAGDDRAALGLAGVAIRSGARSTLATLWLVDDRGTSELMGNLYRELTSTNLSKAEILQRAQLQLLKSDDYQHPYFWAPFVLIGNWL